MDDKRIQIINQISLVEKEIQATKAELNECEMQFKFSVNSDGSVDVSPENSVHLSELKMVLEERIKRKKDLEAQLEAEKIFNRELFFENIEYLLSKNNEKLGVLERLSGNNPGYLSRMKSGKSTSDPSIEFLLNAAEFFKVPLELLITTKLSEMTNTEKMVYEFIDKLCLDTRSETLEWTKEDLMELGIMVKRNKAENIDERKFIDKHPLFINKPSAEQPYNFKYHSLFFDDDKIFPYYECFHATLKPTSQELYIMQCQIMMDDQNPEGYYELYIVSKDNENTKVVPFINTITAGKPLATKIKTLVINYIYESVQHIHIEEGLKDIISSYIKGIPSEDDTLK